MNKETQCSACDVETKSSKPSKDKARKNETPKEEMPAGELSQYELTMDDQGIECEECATEFDIECMPEEEVLYELADLFKVFADTTRIKILYALMSKALSVNDLSQSICATQSAVSHQLRILKQAHLVKFQRSGKSVIYSLSDKHVYTILAQGMTHICE